MYPNYPNQGGYPPSQPGYGGGFGMPQPGGLGFDQPGGYGGGGFPMPGGPAPGGYPGGPAPGGYPGGPAPGGYPGGPAPGGYPGGPAPGGYPGGPAPGYPGSGGAPAPGYPGGPAPGGYPGAGAPVYPGAGAPGYPGAPGGYPTQPGGYPSGPAYPAPGGGYPGGAGGPAVCPPGPGGHYQPGRPPKNPVLRPYQPFNPADDAQRLYKAMKGFGTDEATLIDILCRRTWQQRQEIAIAYKSQTGKDLLKNLESELRGNVETLFKALALTPGQLEAYDLHEAIQGFGTKEDTVIDIVCTKESNYEMTALKNAYRQFFHKEMESDLRGDVSGYFQRFLVSLMAANRSEGPADYGRAAQQAREIYQAGEGQAGTNEMVFNRIFATESFPHLCAIFEEYRKQTGHDIETAIKREMSGDVERAFLAVAHVARSSATYFAKRLHDCMAGAGTHDRSLVRNVVLRSEIDMMDVKVEYQRQFGRPLETAIRSDCSGDYQRGLLCLVGDLNWRH